MAKYVTITALVRVEIPVKRETAKKHDLRMLVLDCLHDYEAATVLTAEADMGQVPEPERDEDSYVDDLIRDYKEADNFFCFGENP